MKDNNNLRKMVFAALVAALSFILICFVRIPIVPAVPFLVFDFADIPLCMLTITAGPVWGLMATVVAALLQGILLSGDGVFGIVMHCLASGVYILAVYYIRPKKMGAVAQKFVALGAATACMTFAMVVLNWLLDPIFYGIPKDVVASLIGPIALFNLLRAVIDSICIYLLWSPFTALYKRFIKQ